jgi:hypothetical protein
MKSALITAPVVASYLPTVSLNSFFADRKISPLFLCKVLCTQLAASTTEIVNAVGAILSYVNFFVWGGNFVADHHGRIETIL